MPMRRSLGLGVAVLALTPATASALGDPEPLVHTVIGAAGSVVVGTVQGNPVQGVFSAVFPLPFSAVGDAGPLLGETPANQQSVDSRPSATPRVTLTLLSRLRDVRRTGHVSMVVASTEPTDVTLAPALRAAGRTTGLPQVTVAFPSEGQRRLTVRLGTRLHRTLRRAHKASVFVDLLSPVAGHSALPLR
jgi:hypothetical protein